MGSPTNTMLGRGEADRSDERAAEHELKAIAREIDPVRHARGMGMRR